ncbi:MAG: CarD family transcriptional regulator [Deltaproteobacteria bacterium]
MAQKKKTSVKAKAAKIVAQPKKTSSSTAGPRGVAVSTRSVASTTRSTPAASKDKKAAMPAKAAPVKPAVASSKAEPVKASKTANAAATAKPAPTPSKAPQAQPAAQKKPAAPSVQQHRSEAAKAAQAFAAHRAQAAQAAAPVRAVPAAVSKSAANTKIAAPASVSATPASPKAIAEKTAAARADASKKPVNSRHGFKTNEFIVYPAHGVGRIIGIEEQEIAGMSLELFVINFEKEKLTLRVPTGKLQSVGMRKLADDDIVKRAMEILKGRARIKRTMWSRRAQEYVAKINSGDLISIAEVVRDLYRSEAQPEQSYSERQLYEDALDRMAREIAAVEKLDDRGAVQRITEVLSKSAKGRRIAEDGEPEEVQAA